MIHFKLYSAETKTLIFNGFEWLNYEKKPKLSWQKTEEKAVKGKDVKHDLLFMRHCSGRFPISSVYW